MIASNQPAASTSPADDGSVTRSRAPAVAHADGPKPSVFISYSRDDLLFTDQLVAALELCGYAVSIDRHGISGGEAWQRRLDSLIQGADTIVFILSPASSQSRTCSWEVECAANLRKRIIPVLCKALQGTAPPKQLQDLNYVFFYDDPKVPGSGFGTGLRNLVAALNTDLDWLREHTRLLQRATEWDAGGRPINRLLSGADVSEAKEWAARRPKGAPDLTPLHFEFLRASELEDLARVDSQRQQNEAVRLAQADRAQALEQAETALKRAQEELRKRARLRNMMLGSVSMLAAIATWFAISAERQQRAMSKVLDSASSIIARVQYQIDDDTRKDFIDVFQRGAALGNAEAMVHLGIFYLNGEGVTKDTAKALDLLTRAAAKGDGEAMYVLGGMYAQGEGVTRDQQAARQWYEKGVYAGNPEAMTEMGRLYAAGIGVAADQAKARQFFEYGAQGGSTSAMIELANIYASGSGVAKDAAVARQWYEKAIASGDTDAMVELGIAYADGTLGQKNEALAVQLFQKAAAKGNPGGMAEMGVALLTGIGTAKDPEKARQWFELAASKGDSDALLELGNLYANGESVKRDLNAARNYYEKSAASGNSDAMVELAVVYTNGEGVPKDFDKARQLLERAAADRNTRAMLQLGKMYETGTGVAKNPQEARNWYAKAAVPAKSSDQSNGRPPKSKKISTASRDKASAAQQPK